MRRLVLAALCAAGPAWAPARADDGPVLLPTRDVDVAYRSAAGSQIIQQRYRFRVADQMLRLDTPSPGLYMIVDQRAHTMAMVSDADRGVVDLKLQGAPAPGGFSPGQSFARRTADVVAGLACTEWQTVDSQRQPVLACFTDDGVLLRARRGAVVLAEAQRVTYGPLDPALFVVPPTYNRVAAPEPRR